MKPMPLECGDPLPPTDAPSFAMSSVETCASPVSPSSGEDGEDASIVRGDASKTRPTSVTRTPSTVMSIDVTKHEATDGESDQQEVSPTDSTTASTATMSYMSVTGSGAMSTVGESWAAVLHGIEEFREVLSDPESPAYAALVKASQEATDASLLSKRPRIAGKKIGRVKYHGSPRPGKGSGGGGASSSGGSGGVKKPEGNEIDDKHAQYALTYGMMCGILNSAGMQNQFKQRLTMDDFMRIDKRVFASASKLQTPFKFKDYAPDIFRQIRRRFAVDSGEYMVTLCGDFNFIEFMSNSKSGQFFFYSHDGRYMIKTQTKDESKFLRRILPHYYKFAMENPNTLITRFYGMHRVKMQNLRRKMHFIIMASVFDTPLEIHARFDLKGSLVGRYASQKEHDNHGVLKDMDLVDSGFRLEMGIERRAMLLVQIRKDVEFLKRMKIMDYSLLIGVHDVNGQIQDTVYGYGKHYASKGKQHQHLRIDHLRREGTHAVRGTRSLPSSPIGNHSHVLDPDTARHAWLPPGLRAAASFPIRRSNVETTDRPTPPAPAELPPQPYNDGGCPPSMPPCPDDECEFSSGSDDNDTSSESSGFVVDRGDLPGDSDLGVPQLMLPPHVRPQDESPKAAAPTRVAALRTNPDMVTLSPRVLNMTQFPARSESLFCKDEGGLYGHDREGHRNGKVYFLGVIDILQQYNSRKMAETFFKGLRHNRKQISAVNPTFYGDRFMQFMEQHVLVDDTLTLRPDNLATPTESSTALHQL